MGESSAVPAHRRAFTLIELLIVVAIIAILAAIAVPNFLEAQVRSKVSAAKANMRAGMMALNSYSVDYNDFPHTFHSYSNHQDQYYVAAGSEACNYFCGFTPWQLTTPLQYMTQLPHDPFDFSESSADPTEFRPNPLRLFSYSTEDDTFLGQVQWHLWYPDPIKWVMTGAGPDLFTWMTWKGSGINSQVYEYAHKLGRQSWSYNYYDPTNGTVSRGDIVYLGPDTGFNLAPGDSAPEHY